MMKPLSHFTSLSALSAGLACATTPVWDDVYQDDAPPAYGSPEAYEAPAAEPSPYMAPVGDEGLGYDAGLGVDPVYSTPTMYEESGVRPQSFVPNDVYMEFFGNMSYNGGGGRVQMVNAVLTVPFVNPQQAERWGWHLDVKGTARLTWLDCKGRNLIDEDNLYTIGVQASVSRQLGRVTQLQLGVTPQFSTDFDVMSHHNFYVGGYVAFSVKASESFRYTVGLTYMPDYYRSLVLPVLSLQWRYHPAWELRVQGSRLSAVCVANERFQWGPFFQWNTGVWTVHRQRQTQQLRVSNCIIGLGATYDVTLTGGSTLSFLADVGGTFNNVFRIRDASGDHTLEKYRSHPGFYGRMGFRFAF